MRTVTYSATSHSKNISSCSHALLNVIARHSKGRFLSSHYASAVPLPLAQISFSDFGLPFDNYLPAYLTTIVTP